MIHDDELGRRTRVAFDDVEPAPPDRRPAMSPRAPRALAGVLALLLPAAGFALGMFVQRNAHGDPHGGPGIDFLWAPPPESSLMRDRTVERLSAVLLLDDAQKAQAKAIINGSFDKAFPKDEEERRRAILDRARAELEAILTPPQRAKLEELRRRGRGPPGGPHGPHGPRDPRDGPLGPPPDGWDREHASPPQHPVDEPVPPR